MNSFVHLTDLLCTQTCLLVSILHEQTLFAAKYVHQTVVLICDIFINLMFFSVFFAIQQYFSSHHGWRICNTVGESGIGSKQCCFLYSTHGHGKHVITVCRSAYLQLRNIGRIRTFLTADATKTLVNSLVTSKLDYCNSLLVGIPNSTLSKLQRVQNTAARIITQTFITT